jgi:hypothetical protein
MEIFVGLGLDRSDRIEAARKMNFCTHAILLFETGLLGKREAKPDVICPAGSRRNRDVMRERMIMSGFSEIE